MRNYLFRVLVVVGIVAVAATLFMLWQDDGDRATSVSVTSSRAPVERHEATTSEQRPTRSGKLGSPPVLHRPGTPRTAVDVDVGAFPTLAELNVELAKPYKDARDVMLAQFLSRQQRRCFRKHRGQQTEIEWTGLETYEVTEGVARLTGLQLIPTSSEAQPFVECVSAGQVGAFQFVVPPETPARFTVREGGGIIHYAEPSIPQIKSEIEDLKKRLERDLQLSPARRAMFEQHLALWQCYVARGLEHRDACAREIDGE